MMQAGVCLRQDTETTLPELTEQHRIRQKEEELSGLESVHMAESETEYAAPGLNTLEPECVSAHSGKHHQPYAARAVGGLRGQHILGSCVRRPVLVRSGR
ncbi:hypothetical protein ANANG_G00027450 [Anguilla anguilla]|uniref:Uncharacterized protein n=1 Tax=Anguilla anguilla TaxID=7936 RepID=A0A9D3S316_ANGAN|nr:hypothetical protein ANANG_G00027450 [Anguilla anguilla]